MCVYVRVAVHRSVMPRMLFISLLSSRDDEQPERSFIDVPSTLLALKLDHETYRVLTCSHSSFSPDRCRTTPTFSVPDRGPRVLVLDHNAPVRLYTCAHFYCSTLYPFVILETIFLPPISTMNPSAQTLREATGSTRRAIPARLLHTLYVFCATSLMLALIVYTFLLILLLRTISPERASRRGRHVTFLVDPEPSTHTPARRAAPPPPVPRLLDENNKPTPLPVLARAVPPSLSLTVTPRELEPPTPDVAEDPLRALYRICAFLVSNTARAAQRDELGTTPPLAGLEPYLDAVRVDLAYIDEVVAGRRAEEGADDEAVATTEVAAAESSEGVEEAAPSADSGIGAGAGVGVDARAHDELGLVQPQQAVSAHASPPPPSQSQSPTPTPHPHAPPPPPIVTHNLYPPPTSNTDFNTDSKPKPKPKPSADSSTTITAASSAAAPPAAGGTRRRKDAVLRAPHASADPGVVDADADDAAVRAAALLARFADIGAELEGTVRERGAALWAALSRRRAPLDLPVPPLPRTRSSAALIAARGAPVVEASRTVAHQAAWRARFAAYGRLFGPVADQV